MFQKQKNITENLGNSWLITDPGILCLAGFQMKWALLKISTDLWSFRSNPVR